MSPVDPERTFSRDQYLSPVGSNSPSRFHRKVLGFRYRGHMRRRDFITLLGGVAATWPLGAHAQQPAGRVYRVGYLSIASRERSLRFAEAFEDGLRRLG